MNIMERAIEVIIRAHEIIMAKLVQQPPVSKREKIVTQATPEFPKQLNEPVRTLPSQLASQPAVIASPMIR